MSELWDLWLDTAHSPAFNMAADEALLLSANQRRIPLLRCYQWDRKAVSIGYVQQLAAAPQGYAAVRRPTGGGVVYHDFDFTYTVAFPSDHWLNGLDRIQSYDWLNRSLQNGLATLNLPVQLSDDHIPHSVDRLTMVCFTNPTKYDLILDGRKIGGSAQRRTHDGLLHQGSLHFGGPLPVDRQILTCAVINGLREVMNVQFQIYTPTPADIARILDLTFEKYQTDAWNAKR